jgi:hypothetical protein
MGHAKSLQFGFRDFFVVEGIDEETDEVDHGNEGRFVMEGGPRLARHTAGARIGSAWQREFFPKIPICKRKVFPPPAKDSPTRK